MGAKLLVKPQDGEPYAVDIGNTATIGRTRDNTVCLRSAQVSRQHAIIRCHNGIDYQVIDLGSLNGTHVDGRRVIIPVTLADGARIRVGDHELEFAAGKPPEADESLEATMAGTVTGGLPESRHVAMLVCDIRGFSAVAEKVAANELAHLLGVWFREAGNAIQAAGGTVDKFIGDALFAYWQAGGSAATASGSALATGRKLLEVACSMTWPTARQHLEVIVALHFGKVTVGNIGLMAQRDATIIGDAVNTVFRLEVLGKHLAVPVILSAQIADALAPRPPLVDLGEHPLKGKQHPIRVFGLG